MSTNVNIPKPTSSWFKIPSYKAFSPNNIVKTVVVSTLFGEGVSALKNGMETIKQTASDLIQNQTIHYFAENATEVIKNLTENTSEIATHLKNNIIENSANIPSQFIGSSAVFDNATIQLGRGNDYRYSSSTGTEMSNEERTGLILGATLGPVVLILGLSCCAYAIRRARVGAAQLMAPNPVNPNAGDYGTLTETL